MRRFGANNGGGGDKSRLTEHHHHQQQQHDEGSVTNLSYLTDSSYRSSTTSLDKDHLNDSMNKSMTSNGRNRVNRYYGDITLEMIDDFLNPMNKKKSAELRHQISYVLPTATNGMGLRAGADGNASLNASKLGSTMSLVNPDDSATSLASLQETNYLPFSLRDQNNNRATDEDYFKQLRKEYEKELREDANSEAMNDNSTTRGDEENSVVGSNMSQLESVSLMSGSVTKHAVYRQKAQILGNLNIQEEDEDDLDQLESRLDSNVHKLINDPNAVPELMSESARRKLHFELLIKEYQMSPSYNEKLPIAERRQDIVKRISHNQFCIILGGTGCGKTTQVPQYILDSYMEQRQYCNIIVTQPRRLAAMSVARRVCDERNWKLGTFCGYQIGLDRSCVGEDTLITYVTTGVLLQKLIGPHAEENFNQKYTHIILDEVHERDLDTDFVLLVIKLKSYRQLKAKIVLMSATIDTSLFQNYFTQSTTRNIRDPPALYKNLSAPLIKISHQQFKVQEFYWDDLTSANSFLSPILLNSYKSKLDQFKKNNYDTSMLFERNRGINVRSYVRSEPIMDATLRSKLASEETLALRKFTQQMQNLDFNYDEPCMKDEAMLMVISLLRYFDEQDIKSIKASEYYCEHSDTEPDEDVSEQAQARRQKIGRKKLRILNGLAEIRGSVLIFVPGMEQIKQLQDLITEELPNNRLNILPLHSDIVIDQQKRVFEKSEPSWRKVIISTTIAESSITVPDVKYVIDFCLTKELYCDPYTNYTHLRMEWASKSSLNQRRGRAGRVSDGTCYRLITKYFHEQMQEHSIPAILREPLHKVILDVKRLKQPGEPKKILSFAIQPPKLSDIERTILLLKEVGALSLKCKDSRMINNPYDGDLTYVGRIMANLPIGVKLSKLILLGHAFGKLREAIIIAAGLSTKTFFTCYYKSHLESFTAKWLWSDGWMCDCLSILNAYNVYESLKQRGAFSRRGEDVRWAKSHMIEINRIREVEQLKNELESRLRELNIVCNRHVKINQPGSRINPPSASTEYNIDNEDMVTQNMILKMIIAGAFYPNYFNGIKLDLQEAVRTMSGRDMKNTVQIKNLPLNEGILYAQNLNDIFKTCSKLVQIHFEDTKAYVEFKSKCEQVSSNVNLGVYLAVQMRLLRIPIRIKRLNAKLTEELLKKYEQLRKANTSAITHTIDSETGLKFNLKCPPKALESSVLISETDSEYDRTLGDDEDEDQANMTQSTLRDKQDEDTDDDEDWHDGGVLDASKYQKPITKYLSVLSLADSTKTKTSSTHSAWNTAPSELKNNRITACKNSLIEYLSHPKYILPADVDQGKAIHVAVTHIVECGHFWAQIDDQSHINTVNLIHSLLNAPSYVRDLAFLEKDELCEETLCAAYYAEENIEKALYRARILTVDHRQKEAYIRFVDYGNGQSVPFTNLFKLSDRLKEYPFQAVECKLHDIKPSLIRNPNCAWTNRSNDCFKQMILSSSAKMYTNLKMEILSLDETVALVNLFGLDSDKHYVSINDQLVKLDVATRLTNAELKLNSNKPKFAVQNVYYVPTQPSDALGRPATHYNAQPNARSMINTKSRLKTQDVRLQNRLNRRFDANDDESDSTETETENNNADLSADEKGMYAGYIDVRGPYSPLEINYFSIINVGNCKRIRVERDSINYVTLDDDPTNEATRLMIATEVTLNESGTVMVLRKTTLLPKIPGLSNVCCLLFSPAIEFRTDDKETCYTGALCGLGYDTHSERPLYTDNDIECSFDVKIDGNDITMINAVRLAINMIIGSEESSSQWANNESNLRCLQQMACDKLLKLINRKRDLIEVVYPKKPFKWNQVKQEKLIDMFPKEAVNFKLKAQDDEKYYNYHKAVTLNAASCVRR